MKERKELRREREKHFENADHSFTAAIYGQPVHFMENGEWEEIDNTVELAADGRYVNKKNDFKVFGWYRIVLGALVLVYFGIIA